MSAGDTDREPSVTVAVVGICSADHLNRCLRGLSAQENAPQFDTVVVHDPHIGGISEVAARFPGVRVVANEGQRTPLELAARAVGEASGDIVLLTEDHCLPSIDWVSRLVQEVQVPGRAAVGGLVETDTDISSVDWAFYYVDFFRYSQAIPEGPSPSLTVCNVAYRREYLQAVTPTWEDIFHETAINDALRSRFGTLWLTPAARVRMRRRVKFGAAVYERYAFGRLFGCTRLEFGSAVRRLYYLLFSPALPALLLFRMGRKAAGDPAMRRRFARGLMPLTALVLAWSWGEWLGYLTRRRPGSLVVAPEIRSAGTDGSRYSPA